MARRSHLKSDDGSSSFAIVANVSIIAILVAFCALQTSSPTRLYLAVQEDGALEWLTFWGFLVAACAFIEAAGRQRHALQTIPWFAAGLGLFCFLVAMEEISWGQRVFGYRPPAYFLKNNFQQELNLHNVMGADLRAHAVEATICLYGILLPLLRFLAPAKRAMQRIGVIAPPATLVPAFTVMLVFYVWDPWQYLAEAIEAMLALGFMFGGLWMMDMTTPREGVRYASLSSLSLTLAAVGCLSIASAAFSQSPRGIHPRDLKAAIEETKMLKQDFLAIEEETGNLPSVCGVQDRIYNFAWESGSQFTQRGSFASLVQRGLPAERASFFIDPWDTAYWVNNRCDAETGERVVFVYSMGPNRRRDSTKWRIRGDDI